MTRPDIEAMELLEDKATQGPWEVEPTNPRMSGEQWNLRIAGKAGIRMVVNEYQHGTGNADFIAAAREYIPAIHAYVRGIEAKLSKAEGHRDRLAALVVEVQRENLSLLEDRDYWRKQWAEAKGGPLIYDVGLEDTDEA